MDFSGITTIENVLYMFTKKNGRIITSCCLVDHCQGENEWEFMLKYLIQILLRKEGNKNKYAC